MKIGDHVQTGVYVLGEFKPVYTGVIVGVLYGLFQVDIGSLHGCQPWIHLEQESHLRLCESV